MICPCKDCKRRYPGCHDCCLIYKEWHTIVRASKEELRKEAFIMNPVAKKNKAHYDKLKLRGHKL